MIREDPTQLPVPSNDFRDAVFNSEKLDEWATSIKDRYIDRFGDEHYTSYGMELEFAALLKEFQEQMNIAIESMDYTVLESFQKGVSLPGGEITLRTQAVKDERTGVTYRWLGNFPKKVPFGSTPETTGGIKDKSNPDGLWLGVGDVELRYELGTLSKTFTTVAAMKSDSERRVGEVVRTQGYRTVGDGGDGLYLITQNGVVDNLANHILSNGLTAELVHYSLKSLGLIPGADATTTINLMLQRDKPVFIDDLYVVNVDGNDWAIKPKTGSYIEWRGKGALKLKASGKSAYEVISIKDVTSCTLIRPKLIGDRTSHLQTVGGEGHGISINTSQNVLIDNPDIQDMWGDGLYINTPTEANTAEASNATKNIEIINGSFKNNRRQGFTIAGGRDIRFKGRQVCSGTKGTGTESGFNIEADSFRPIKGLSIQSVLGKDCNGYSFSLYSNTGTRIMEDINIGELISINGRLGSLNISSAADTVPDLLKSIKIDKVYQCINSSFAGLLADYNGVSLSRVKGIKIGEIDNSFEKAVRFGFRASNGATAEIDNLHTGGATMTQVTTTSDITCAVLTHKGKAVNESLEVSVGGKLTIGSIDLKSNWSGSVIDANSALSVLNGKIQSASVQRDVNIIIGAGARLNLTGIEYDVLFTEPVVQNSGTLHARDVNFGFGRKQSTGVLALTGSKSYLTRCSMLNDAGASGNSLIVFNAGSGGYAVGSITSDTDAIKIQGDSSAKNVDHVAVF